MRTFAKFSSLFFVILCSIAGAFSAFKVLHGEAFFLLPLLLNTFAVVSNFQFYKRLKNYETNVG